MTTGLPALPEPSLPPILAGCATPEVKQRVHEFYSSVAQIFES